MSHIVSIQTQVRDPAAIAAACQRLHLPAPVHGSAQLFNGQSATGIQVTLPDWRYPVICDVASGQLHYDNFSGHWGEQRHLDRFLQAYAVENSKRSQCTSINGRVGRSDRRSASLSAC